MKFYKNICSVILLSAALAACAGPTLVKPGTVSVDDTLTVQALEEWNKWPFSDGKEIWTLDGPDLQSLIFDTHLKEGENVFRRVATDNGPTAMFDTMPKFRKGMTPIEIGDMFIASYQQMGFAGVRISKLRNRDFAGRSGFYFELEYADKEGLERRGIVHGTVQGDVMHMITYFAPKLHYFDRDRQRVERLISSARFL